MKRFVLSTVTLLIAAAIVAPAASAVAVDNAADLNGDGMISMQEARLHFLNTHDSSL
ncbi:MAG: hypothetical protein F6J97_04865 [Leptolyngbya sp. SIO4C1]|nr:hypothetical protein [Leptolyngbya sp. SIO4C1]